MQSIQFPKNGSRSYHTWTIWLVYSRSAARFPCFFASGHLALAAEPGQPKNILILYSFSERRLFDPLDSLKSAIRSRLNSPMNFYVHYMEAQGFEDPVYEKSLSKTLSREYTGVKLDLVIVAAYPALPFRFDLSRSDFSGRPSAFLLCPRRQVGGQAVMARCNRSDDFRRCSRYFRSLL